MPVNKERVMLLVERLRDPNSKQHKGALRASTRSKAMCCLGHGCEVYRVQTGEGKWKTEDGVFRFGRGKFVVGSEESTGVLPQIVANWYGFRFLDPDLFINGKSETASSWNDNFGKTLAEIADGFEALCNE